MKRSMVGGDESKGEEEATWMIGVNGDLVRKRKKYKPRERYHVVDGVLVKKQWGRPKKKKKEEEVGKGDDGKKNNERVDEGRSESRRNDRAGKKNGHVFNVSSEMRRGVEERAEEGLEERRRQKKGDWERGRKKAFEELIGLRGGEVETEAAGRNDGESNKEILNADGVPVKSPQSVDGSPTTTTVTTSPCVIGASVNQSTSDSSTNACPTDSGNNKQEASAQPTADSSLEASVKKEAVFISNPHNNTDNKPPNNNKIDHSDNTNNYEPNNNNNNPSNINPSNNTSTHQHNTSHAVEEKDLLKIQKRLGSLEDPLLLREVINIIDGSGSYNVEASSLDIDLYTLSSSTVEALMKTLGLQ